MRIVIDKRWNNKKTFSIFLFHCVTRKFKFVCVCLWHLSRSIWKHVGNNNDNPSITFFSFFFRLPYNFFAPLQHNDKQVSLYWVELRVWVFRRNKLRHFPLPRFTCCRSSDDVVIVDYKENSLRHIKSQQHHFFVALRW
jgi:hypothetical protein